ncbi:HAD-IA family hydrolase [Brevibacillus humidisoli]|uniref:HAD family hydrolase n=1 Tax=Brevibacillus humidisoli TaxID=2895522 RepID=UPI001E58B6D2|nr:HAD-IA family hydrolase [Brevibacillus humidisoli]UFJ40619.1 HAD-IA family hydrolase [Brevibacillus humidisoli]
MSKTYTILFDMDGTLLQTEKLAVAGFTCTFEELRQRGLWDGPMPDEEQLTNVLGLTLEQVWGTLLPGEDESTKQLADRLMLSHEQRLLKEGVTDLYPGVRELLAELHAQGVALFVASNGLEAYIDSICEHFAIKSYFTDLYSAGRFQTKSKTQLVEKLLHDYPVKQAVMVGDRQSDVQAGKANGLFTIACDFGFAKPGELDEADVIIHQFSELTAHLPFSLTNKT